MKSELRSFLDSEISAYQNSIYALDYQAAWNHLEKAHIISQPYALAHIYVHILMIQFAWNQKNFKEILGQIPRILLAGPGSLLGLAPKGNTGGANVGIFTPMQIPEDLDREIKRRS